MSDNGRVKLTIVIPALNEEDAIGSTIERCLAAREQIIEETGVTEVGVVVVSDGSTDRTPEIAQGYDDVHVIVFEQNQGYGAAIKEGWRQGNGELLAFLDADGTCDPKYFIPMCNAALNEKTDVVLGNRMGPNSEMPTIRRVGNTMFAILLGALSRKSVADTASGMRVIRKDALDRLLPLPNGLQFTPAMSARVLMDDSLKIKEVPMDYAERIGESKLSASKDGVRFLRVIFSAAVYLKPSRVTLPLAGLLTLIAVLLAIRPIRMYIAEQSVEEWMIYRFLFILMLGMMSVALLTTTAVAERMIALARLKYNEYMRSQNSIFSRQALQVYLIIGAALFILGIVLVWPGIVEYVTTGHIEADTLHWSRVVVAAFCVLTFWQMLATACLIQIVSALNDRQRFLVQK